MRRALAVLASIGFGLGTIALATPAQATEATVEFGSGGLVVNGTPVSAGYPVRASTITFKNNFVSTLQLQSATPGYLTNTGPGGGDCNDPANCQITVGNEINLTVEQQSSSDRVDVLGPGSIANFRVEYDSGGGGGGGDDSGSSGGAGSAPASEIQQFGLPTSGNCEDGATDAMNWSGVGLDGWGISWAQWANDGAGGAVCTRTVMYDTSTAKWTVN